ncbi:hypothetical protein KO494_12515 [Lacinutrix sp. C3R15]|uniref:hypothetical protein n=1 Tax=Flavobacteriaceae TaxID=49546 RepID=UPI001C0A22FE|nr:MULTISPECIES: hypothetical protein [Flavobacteriaceae]MBU2940361.1 hypothetical protein [Lacinutrix sp. C3R15]MDO6623681.1 hypothetical protein [Oceanihabitans sp. 1_MG-2023]
MATYKCQICGIQKYDTVSSQLNTSITCKGTEVDPEVGFHGWELVSSEDLICN